MNKLTRTTVVLTTLAGTLALPGTALASGLTVTIPCGCQPVQNQPVGAATTTPAVDNPSGSVGNVSGAGTETSWLIYPSGAATFSP